MRSLGLLLLCSALPSLGCDPKVEVPPDDEIGGDPAPTDDDEDGATDDEDDDAPTDDDASGDAPDEDPPADDDDANTDTDVPTAEGTACEDWGTAQACEVEGVAGMQFCDYFEGGMAWGACMTDFECIPGETRAAS